MSLTTAQALAALGLTACGLSSLETPRLAGDYDSDCSGLEDFESETPYLGADLELLGADALELLGADAGELQSLLGADVELLGSDAMELLGADGMELLGADARTRRRLRPRGAAIARAARIQKELFLPVPATALPAATPNAIINVQPQLTCQINQLVIPSNVGPFYMVNDVIIGTRSQFAAPGAVSGVGLSEVQTGSLKGDTATLGTIISVNITNISGADKVLQGAYFRVRALVQ